MGSASTVVEKAETQRDKVLELTIEELDLSVRSVEIRVQDLHLAVGLNVSGSDLALAGGLNVDRFDLLGVELGNDGLHIEDDLGHVLLHAGDGGKFMLDTLKGTVTKLPAREDIDLPIEEHLIVELYSK